MYNFTLQSYDFLYNKQILIVKNIVFDLSLKTKVADNENTKIKSDNIQIKSNNIQIKSEDILIKSDNILIKSNFIFVGNREIWVANNFI
jgi:hypothetical protein